MEIPVSKLCKNIERVSLYENAPQRRLTVFAVGAVLYAVVLRHVYSTMGEPLRRATLELEELKDHHLLKEDSILESGEFEATVSWGDDGQWQDKGEATVDFDDSFNIENPGDGLGKTDSILDTDIEIEEERPLPKWWLPDASAAAALFSLVSGTVLFQLLCHWFVWFRALVYMKPALTKPVSGFFALVVPYTHRGQSDLTIVYRDKKSDRLCFRFQHQEFELLHQKNDKEVKLMGYAGLNGRLDHDDEHILIDKLSPEERIRCEEYTRKLVSKLGAFSPISPKVDLPVSAYYSSRGLSTRNMVDDVVAKYGTNVVEMGQKSLVELVKEGVLSPLSMFQLFSAALWLMDGYWQFTMYSLFSIVMMEFMTAFQRHKTLGTLKNLAPKPYELPVFRENKWIMLKTVDLLPGDMFSMSSQAHQTDANSSKSSNSKNDESKSLGKADKANSGKRGVDNVPCDCLILHGNCVVNEATLTGESVPQMKDALQATSHADPNTPLDIKGQDRVHVMFSGTTLVSASPGPLEGTSFPETPDGGCLCYVLRTGFGSSQGELMQMIEFSTEQVSADSRETGLVLLVLLCFALASSAYVFKVGMEKGNRTTHELLLKCVIILTSVVPRQLPVQMSLAVNHALLTLHNQGIFCTEPYRVPLAGKITHCLFDKTGTLTTDELVPAGIVNSCATLNTDDEKAMAECLKPVKDASVDATLVLAACHSLVSLPSKSKDTKNSSFSSNELLGDPIELAAMKGVGWSYNPSTRSARPGDLDTAKAAISILAKDIENLEKSLQKPELTQAHIDSAKTIIASKKEKMSVLGTSLQEATTLAANFPIQNVEVLRRFHFSSKLQRMSVVCKIQRNGSESFDPGYLCLAKGSPEAIKLLLDEKSIPDWYSSVYRRLAEKGMRVLALASRVFSADIDLNQLSRGEAEHSLSFCGFIGFECKIRADSSMVIRSLKDSSHFVGMLTGDSPLTALHVARATNICPTSSDGDMLPLLLTVKADKKSVEWVVCTGPREMAKRIPFETDSIVELKKRYCLLTTEDALLCGVECSRGLLWNHVHEIQVFARMSPDGKAKVIRMIQQFQSGDKSNLDRKKSVGFLPSQSNFVMMVGDGGNDVGALKQADVGLALLGGYGEANTDKSIGDESLGEDAEMTLNREEEQLKIRQKVAKKEYTKEFNAKKKILISKQQELIAEEIAAAERRGETGIWAKVNAGKAVAARLRDELRRENEVLQRKHQNAFKKKTGSTIKEGDLSALALDALDDPNALPVVRPGDASVAAPFTSRVPSVRAAVHLIRQGRCTLLSALQQQGIMCLESVIAAYCQAALSLEGFRSSERQMIASAWLVLIASLAFSYSTPVEKVHPVRPVRSLFDPVIVFSILGQACIHLFCIVYATSLAKEAMGEEALAEVVAFNRKIELGLDQKIENEDMSTLDFVADMMMVWNTPFKPNLLSTCIFLVETSQTMAVLFVNYKGRPWMLGMIENHALFLSLFLCIGGLIFATFEFNPELNSLIHLDKFPDNEFRLKIIGLVMLTLCGTFAWDRLMTAIFSPKAFKAQWDMAMETRITDIVPILTSLVKVVLGFAVVSSGNPLIWIGAYWLYQKYKSRLEEEEIKKLNP